jgi:hypothetical protein
MTILPVRTFIITLAFGGLVLDNYADQSFLNSQRAWKIGDKHCFFPMVPKEISE